MKKNYSIRISWISLTISIIATIISIIAICVSNPNKPELGFDYQGIIVGILALLVTILLGWQIYSSIFIEKKINSKIKKAIDARTEFMTKRVYINISNVYSAMYLEAYRNADAAGMILYNDMKIMPAIYSGEEQFAKDIITNAKYIVPLIKKGVEQDVLIERITKHSSRLKKLCEKYPSLIDEYLEFRKNMDDTLVSHE